MEVLAQLSIVGKVTQQDFEARYDWMFPSHSDTYYIIVIVDKSKDKVIGTATMLLERKFMRSTGIVSVYIFLTL
jgi:glucosamine-phosphate N-acetyltransferase